MSANVFPFLAEFEVVDKRFPFSLITLNSSRSAGGSGTVAGNCLVRVRAQVMVRDDSTGGWVNIDFDSKYEIVMTERKVINDDILKDDIIGHSNCRSIKTLTVESCVLYEDLY